eukprot:1092530-Pleurochrysis_carterae.AAC.1
MRLVRPIWLSEARRSSECSVAFGLWSVRALGRYLHSFPRIGPADASAGTTAEGQSVGSRYGDTLGP